MLSGAVAGVAGGLFVHMNHSFSLAQYGAFQSFGVFTSAIIGGLGSITGVVIGALYSRTTLRLHSLEWRLLTTSIGVLLILLVMPSGLGSQITKVRDLIARAATRRQNRSAAPAAASESVEAETPAPVVAAPTARSVEAGASS